PTTTRFPYTTLFRSDDRGVSLEPEQLASRTHELRGSQVGNPCRRFSLPRRVLPRGPRAAGCVLWQSADVAFQEISARQGSEFLQHLVNHGVRLLRWSYSVHSCGVVIEGLQ